MSDSEVKKVALDIARWFINGDRPDEWKLKEWAERLDPDAISAAYADLQPMCVQPDLNPCDCTTKCKRADATARHGADTEGARSDEKETGGQHG